ncbi:MAG TPA: DUF6491 family protein [Allosphingosinicella sp.]|jgi:hypothetical protein
MRTLLAAAATALLLGCAPTQADMADRRALAEARPVGPPVDCVPLTGIRETRVRDDATIDFYMRGGSVYRNRLPSSCPQLGFEERFAYATSISRLCSIDTITVLTSNGRGASCGLGDFQPIALDAR